MLTNTKQHQKIDSHQQINQHHQCPGCQIKRPTYIISCDNCKTLKQCTEQFDQCCNTYKQSHLQCSYNKCDKQDTCLCYQTFIINPPKIEELKGANNETKNEIQKERNDNYNSEFYFNLIISEIDKQSKCDCCRNDTE